MLTPKTHKALVAIASILLATAAIVARRVYGVGPILTVPVMATLLGLLVWQMRNQSPYRSQTSGLHLRK